MEAIASRYAESLFDLALEANSLDKYYQDMELVETVLDSDPKIVQFFSHILIEDSAKIELLDKSFKGVVDTIVLNFLKLLVQKKRMRYIKDIVKAFRGMTNDYKGIKEGIIYSAYDLSDDQVKSLEDSISKKENKTVHLKVIQNPLLVGGVQVQIDNRVYDGSIKNKLESLRKELLRK